MKFSLKWLDDFIEVQPFFKDPGQLATALTQSGLEVDSFEDQKAQFKNIVTAQIKSEQKHPQADRLTVCQVKTDAQTYSIVCGAKNHKAGDKVVLAKIGAVLQGDFKIKKSRIRGVDSEGMLVSRSELGFDSKEEGIWILPKKTELGKSLAELEGWNDVIFEITVPPNRSDCLSHKGLAREISALFSIPFSQKEFSIERSTDLSIQKSLSVEVEDKQACPRYCACLIEGVKIQESPSWLKERLKSLGLKSINNVVDITNFVLWDRGQPLHAFDRDKIENIKVSLAKKEKFLALDESELELTEEDLSIRDNKKVLALAGVIGGLDSSITAQTKNIVIESACFAPEKIRKTSRRFGLETDSSYRFARGVDAFEVKSAMDLACFLIQKEAGGRVSKDFYDLNYLEKKKPKIKISLSDLSERLGCSVSGAQFEKWMINLGCEVSSHSSNFEVTAPSYRSDLKIKEDLIEEFARLEGYHQIP
ncbi:MAG: phenylalanine--tRNA ligase subunit beta, partial [Oligoflexia bacterium]|nr:phenylalanine--tRNA ligase subunit beta [Oligoflexia bacterium]